MIARLIWEIRFETSSFVNPRITVWVHAPNATSAIARALPPAKKIAKDDGFLGPDDRPLKITADQITRVKLLGEVDA